MDFEKNLNQDDANTDVYYGNDYIFAGPLNLNMMTRQANTVMGVDIDLGENDFEALYLLSTKENEYLTFQQLYEAAWGRSESTDSIDFASAALYNLVEQINNVGDQFMWIEHQPGIGYRFITRWGHNWRGNRNSNVNNPDKAKAFEDTLSDTKVIDITMFDRKISRPGLKTLLAGAGALVAAFILVLLLLYSTGIIAPTATEPLYIDVEDTTIPLAASPESDP